MPQNDTIIYFDPILGNLTIQDLIYYLDSLILDNTQNFNILESILKNNKLDDSDIASIINKFDMEYNIKFLRDMLSDSL